jgi:hypothetical protein
MQNFRLDIRPQFIVISIICIFLAACSLNSGDALITENMELQDFSGIVIEGIGNFSITQSDHNSLIMVGEPGIIETVSHRIIDGILYIEKQDNMIISQHNPQLSLQFHLTVKELSSIHFSGSGSLTATDLAGKYLNYYQDAVGNSNLVGLNYDAVNLTLLGGGNILVTGTIREQNIEMLGSISYDSAGIQSQVINAQLSGSARAIVWVNEILNAEAEDDSKLRYYGDPHGQYLGKSPDNVEALGLK